MKSRELDKVLVPLIVALLIAAYAHRGEAHQAVDQNWSASMWMDEAPGPAESFRSNPVMFVENAGQWNDDARFQVWGGPAGTMWLAEDAIWITVLEAGEGETSSQVDKYTDSGIGLSPGDPEPAASGRGVNIKLSFTDANPHLSIEAFGRLDTTVSYFYGNDLDKWRPDVPVWGGVRYVDLYPGIDLELTSEDGRLAPRLAARVDADLSAVRLLARMRS